MILTNPFLVTGYYNPDYFCDREKETASMTNALYSGRNLTLIAPRRMGKTGLIKNVFYKLKEKQPDIVTIYMDIYPTQNLGDFTTLFVTTVLNEIDNNVSQKMIKRITEYIKSFRPVFTIDPLTGSPRVSVEIAKSTEEASLREVFDYMGASDKRYYIAIDEFQQIASYPEKGVEALLRSYIQFLPNVNFIFSGSKQHVIQDMFLSAKRPFYQSTQILSIDRIDRGEYYKFASDFFRRKKNLALEEDVFSNVYDTFEGHTWYIQAILNRLFSYPGKPDKNLVTHVVDEIIEESVYSYEILLAAYSAGNIRLIKAIAKEGRVKEINSGEFISKYDLKAASSVNTSLKKIIDKELVCRSSNGYMVYDRFMSIWLSRQPY